VPKRLHRHILVHHYDKVYEADAVAPGTEQGSDDAKDDSESVVDAGGVAGSCGAAGNVSPGGVDDGGDAHATLHGGRWASGSSDLASTTNDELPHDARTCSSDSGTSQSDQGSDGSTTGTDSDEEDKSEEDTPAEYSPDEDNRPNVNTDFDDSLLVLSLVEMQCQMDYGASLSGQVLEWYHSLHDVDRAEPVFSGRDDISDLRRSDTPCLRRVFTYACTASRAGLGRQQTNFFFAVLRSVERHAGGDEPFAERFPSKTACWKGIQNEKRRKVEALWWNSLPVVIADITYHLLDRDALNMTKQLAFHTRAEQLQWDENGLDDAEVKDDHAWSGPFGSAAHFDRHKDVTDTLPKRTQSLGHYGYSDTTGVTSMGGTLTRTLCVVDCVLLHPTPSRPQAQSAIPSGLFHTSWSYMGLVRPCRALTST